MLPHSSPTGEGPRCADLNLSFRAWKAVTHPVFKGLPLLAQKIVRLRKAVAALSRFGAARHGSANQQDLARLLLREGLLEENMPISIETAKSGNDGFGL